ncbi:hypothetical protein JCM14469_39180 [Desulfatiferula olefinivorans]
MKFEGNLSKFFPPDLLLFLANMGQEGMLTVSDPNDVLTIFFKNGQVVDARSRLADDKMLKALVIRKHIDRATYRHIMVLRRETGMGLMEILEKLSPFPLNRIDEIVIAGIREVVFQFFLLKDGSFEFSSIHVEQARTHSALAPQTLAFEIARWVDEWADIERTFSSFDRKAHVKDTDSGSREPEVQMVLNLLGDGKTIRDILDLSPMPSFETLKVVEKIIENSWAVLLPREKNDLTSPADRDDTFHSFKKAFKGILTEKEPLRRVKGLIDFCKDHFDLTFLFSATKTTLIRSVVFYVGDQGTLKSRETRNTPYAMAHDPVFSRVYTSGFSFFGHVFQTAITNGLYPMPEAGECAIIPLSRKGDRINLLFAVAAPDTGGLGPFHYLELLSWLVNPHTRSLSDDGGLQHAESRPSNPAPKKDVSELIRDLPPMPHLAAHMLQILSDPDSSVDDLTGVMIQDQAMAATLIKVANSALYRTGRDVVTLNDAVAKLGFKAVRSLVLTATTQSLFPKNNKSLEMISHDLWQHSKECGLASRIVAEALGAVDPEEAFVAGLLHDIGKLAMLLTYTSDYQDILRKQRVDGCSSLEAEKTVLGFDHCEIGAMFMDKWHMPRHLKEAVIFHHLSRDGADVSPHARVVCLGNLLSHTHGNRPDERLIHDPAPLAMAFDALKIDSATRTALTERVASTFKHADIFD